MVTEAPHAPAGVDGWGRRRLLAVVVGVLVAGTALLGGLGYAVYLALAPSANPVAGVPSGVSSEQGPVQVRRDGIAAAAMLTVTPQDALPAPPAAETAPGILVPPASSSGPGGVPTGFPRTPEGAVGQLAAIETTVFQAMSMPLTAEVHQHWTLPPTPEAHNPAVHNPAARIPEAGEGGVAGWEIARHVQSFLGTAQMGPEKDLTTVVTATPAAGLVKGVDGPDWVLACVLLEVRAVITTEARIGYGHCERMQWHDGRWQIAPGAAPARAPSTWPGSQRSIDAGWRTWVDTDTTAALDTPAGEPGIASPTDGGFGAAPAAPAAGAAGGVVTPGVR